MFLTILSFCLIGTFIIIVICGYGYFFEKLIFKKKFLKLYELGFFGYILIFLLSNFIHFFLPLTFLIALIFMIIGIVAFFFYLRKNYKQINLNVLISLILFCLASLTINYHDDSYWYQLPYINYYQNYKSIIGINTLNFFYYGHGLYDIMAIFNINFLPNSTLYLVPCSIIFFISLFILEEIKLKKFSIGSIFLLFFGLLILYRYTRSKEYGADLITMCYMFLVFYYFLQEIYLIGKKNIFKIYSFFIFAIFSKPYAIFVVIFPLFIFFKKFAKTVLYLKNVRVIIFVLFFFAIPFTKNYLHSSCLYYPVKITCFSSNTWYLGDDVMKQIGTGGLAIAKGFKNYVFERGNPYLTANHFLEEHKYTYLKYLVLDKDFERLIIALSIFILSFFIFFKKNMKKNENKKYNITVLLLSFFSLTLWFFFLPQSRYGGNIILLIFIGSLALYIFDNYELYFSKKAKVFLILSIVFFIFKNIKRIDSEITFANKNQINFPFKKLNLYSADKRIIENEIIYVSNHKLFCVNIEKLCTTKLNYDAIDGVIKSSGYLQIIPDRLKLKEALSDIAINHKKLWINYK